MLTEHDLDRVLALKRKGFGNWDDADLDASIDLERMEPAVRDFLLPPHADAGDAA
jgi:hypothetical protein